MKTSILLGLALIAIAPAAGATDVISAKDAKELKNYWVYDHAASLPLAEASGMDTVVPPDLIRTSVPWKKTYTVHIDSTGTVTSATCMDCAADDPVAPIVAKSFFTERYTPAAGNATRQPVQALLPAELIPPAS